MRTLIDIDDRLLEEAMALTGARTKKEIIHLSLEEIVRARLRQQLKAMAGSGIVDLGLEELRQLRYARQNYQATLQEGDKGP
jgi:Arc/MetJ family transcription regulator